MNDIIRYELPKYLDYLDLLNLSMCCKYYNYLLKNILFNLKKIKQEQIEEIFNFYIIDMVSKEKLLKARYIPWKLEWDNNFLKDFNYFNGSIAYTKDNYNRGFIFTKIKVENPVNDDLPYTNYTIMVLYQKYSDIEVYFVSDPENYCITTMNNGIFLEKSYFHHFKNFFSLGTFSYLDFPYEFPFPPLYQKIFIFR